MGVQDVVAKFNKSKPATTARTSIKIPKVTKTTQQPFPLSPSSSPTSTINSSASNTILGRSSSISSVLQKFDSPPTSTTTKNNNNNNTQPPVPPIPTIHKQLPATPIESSVIKTRSRSSSKVAGVRKSSLQSFSPSRLNRHLDELADLFQGMEEQNKVSEEYITRLQFEVEKYSSDATKVRDYEIRVEYLAQKLEQVSEERDGFEKELIELRNNNNNSSNITTPLSPPYSSQHYPPQEDIILEHEQRLQDKNNDDYVADILNVYEEIQEDDQEEDDIGAYHGGDMQLFEDDDRFITEQEHQQQQQQQESEKSVQMAIVQYLTELETQKLETKKLEKVVKVQEQLIQKLERKSIIVVNNNENHGSNNNDYESSSQQLLQEQVEVQKIELDNKRILLAQLLNEREDLLRKLDIATGGSSSADDEYVGRSSIDMISNFAISTVLENSNDNSRPASYVSNSSTSSSMSGKGTSPLTHPPRQPLPALPALPVLPSTTPSIQQSLL